MEADSKCPVIILSVEDKRRKGFWDDKFTLNLRYCYDIPSCIVKVDARLLKAAAIEHSDDPDASVEFILTEVLPYITEKLCVSTCTSRSLAGLSSVEYERYRVTRLAVTTCASPRDRESNSFVGKAFNGLGKTNKPGHVDPACLNEAVCSF